MPPAFILSQDQTLRSEKSDLTIQVLLLHKVPAAHGRGMLGAGPSPAPARRIALFRFQRGSRPKTGVPHNMARENGIASPEREYFGKKRKKDGGKERGRGETQPARKEHPKTNYRIERSRRIRSSRGGCVANSAPKLGKLIYIEAKALPPNSWTSLRVIPFSQF